MKQRALTTRERSVIEAVARGLSNKEVSAELGITDGTVKTYLSRIRDKHPSIYSRHLLVKHLLRDEERGRAVALSGWIKKWGGILPEDARSEIDNILAIQVAEILK